jgi:hypothetical protein
VFDPDTKKLDKAVVAVSRLCCPACWELLRNLRDSEENLWVLGHHSTLFPVELPDWLPTEVLQKMALQFRKYLSDILQQLSGQKGVHLQHARPPSLQSDSGSSGSSGMSDSKDVNTLSYFIPPSP